MSLGINVLLELVKKAASVLGDSYDIEIVERHHRRKVDAPSGTALMIADAAAGACGHETEYVFERHSVRHPRDKKEIGISAVRGGTIVGEHEIIFAGHDEVMEIRHTALSREIFAQGAVEAARVYGREGARPVRYEQPHPVSQKTAFHSGGRPFFSLFSVMLVLYLGPFWRKEDMAVAAAILAALCISLIIFRLHNLSGLLQRGSLSQAEEARVHAENCHPRAGSSYYLYFHVPCRDTVVTCQVPPDIWYYLSKGDRGTLCHQGGRFISFTRDGELIAVDPVAERHQLWRIHGS